MLGGLTDAVMPLRECVASDPASGNQRVSCSLITAIIGLLAVSSNISLLGSISRARLLRDAEQDEHEIHQPSMRSEVV